jgi:diacylglycerol kinase (ATP)
MEKNEQEVFSTDESCSSKEDTVNTEEKKRNKELEKYFGELEESICLEEEKETTNNVGITIFLFINPLSGLRAGKILLERCASREIFEDLGQVYLINIRDNKSKELGIKRLKDYLSISCTTPYLFIAGGDGSFISIFDELLNEGMDSLRLAFGILPFGTGNDLAQVTGWGAYSKDIMKPTVSGTLINFISELKNAETTPINIWEVQVECADANDICYIDDLDNKRKEIATGNKSLKRHMIDYFSVGEDASIGFGFEKHRSSSTFWNKFCYGWEGFKKLCGNYLSPVKISKIISTFSKTNNEQELNIINFNDTYIEHFSSILFLNIGSFMGGKSKPWSSTKRVLDASKEFQKESYNDNKLEVLIFANTLRISLETIIGGNAKRVAQDTGPFKLRFKKQDITTYMQIDGEYFKIRNPLEINIKLASSPTINIVIKKQS